MQRSKFDIGSADAEAGRIIFMSLFREIEQTKKGNTETCLHKAKEVAALVLPGARVRKHVVEQKFQRTSRNMG